MEASAKPEAKSKGQGTELAVRFGATVRERRKGMRMSQEDLALVSGVGRRFVIDLEAGKATCELGLALVVANAVGLRTLELFVQNQGNDALLPEFSDEGSST